jgi:dihydrofolate reductase
MSRTRRIAVFIRIAANGYFAAPGGGLEWVVPDPDVDRAAMEGPAAFDTFLFGRRTYELFERFWPRALDDPAAAAPHGGGPLSDDQRAMAASLNETTKLVFSRTLREVSWKNARLVPELDPAAIRAMKNQPGRDMLVLGSGSLVSQLTGHGLIDEYQFVVSPVLLGTGRPFLHDVTSTVMLDLLETRVFPTGNVLLRYACRA